MNSTSLSTLLLRHADMGGKRTWEMGGKEVATLLYRLLVSMVR